LDADEFRRAVSLAHPEGNQSGLRCEVQYLSGRYPKYVKSQNLAGPEAMAALFFEASGKRVAYVPAVGSLSAALLEKIRDADLLLFDGTFWSDDELIRVQAAAKRRTRWDIFRSKKACDC